MARTGAGGCACRVLRLTVPANTNWQWYSGEQVTNHLTQMVGLGVQNFVSAAAGMAVAVALIHGVARSQSSTLGNFWVDITAPLFEPSSDVVRCCVGFTAVGVVQSLDGTKTFSDSRTVGEPRGTYTDHRRRTRRVTGGDQAAQFEGR